PDYVIDDGAELTARIGKYRPDVFQSLKGVSEQTTTGTARLYALEHAGKLPFPALTANNARCKHMFDNRYGTGQTTLQAVLRLSGRRLAGSKIAVIGYGYVGRGIAEYAAKLHARVMVIEVDPVRALEAHMDGHHVGTAHDVLPNAEFVITATGGIRALARQDFSLLTHDVILANAGHHDLEIDVDALSNTADTISHPNPDTTTYTLGTRDVHVLCNGALVNIAGGSGHPVEIMDLSFAVQGIGAHYLINTPLDPGVHVLPKVLDDAIARSKLESLGVTLAQPRPEQVDRHDGLIDEIEL
ncbi:MAG: adenosylhomocysteinase, partial [Pseudomonadota bacterium]